MTVLRAASATDAGKVRPNNQDSALVGDMLVAVADGMGGHAAGEVAAEIAVVELKEAFAAKPTLAGLVAATERANRIIFNKGETDAQLHGMGTTLTAVAVVPVRGGDAIGIVNVGDSRAYLFDKGKLEQLTEDHSLVEEMVRRGDLSESEAAVHPHRHILTRALGIDTGVEVDSWQIKPRANMRILLCSDGLTNECTDDEIAAILGDHGDVQEAAQALVDQALRHGGNDNITVVVADVDTENVAPLNEATDSAIDAPQDPTGPSGTTAESAELLLGSAMPTTAVLSASPSAAKTAPTPVPPSSTVATVPTSPPNTGKVPVVRPTGAINRRLQIWRNLSRDDPSTVYVPNGPMFTPRVVFFVIAMLLVVGSAVGFVVWFDRATYFVGVKDGNIAIFNGRPNNLLWMHPTVVETTSVTTNEVLPSSLTILRSGILESSFADAKKVVTNLSTEGSAFGVAPTTTTTAPVVTTTTIVATTTTTTPAKTTKTKAAA